MAITPTLLSAGRYTAKYLLEHDGGSGGGEDILQITNADLMSGALAMADGPLKDLWRPTYATLAAGRAALNQGEHMEVIMTMRGAAGADAAPWGVDVAVAGPPGLPSVMVYGTPGGDTCMLQLNYRHSTGR